MTGSNAKDLMRDARKEMANFNLEAFLRGAQLTIVGGMRFSILLELS